MEDDLAKAREALHPDTVGFGEAERTRFLAICREQAQIYALIDIAESLRLLAGRY